MKSSRETWIRNGNVNFSRSTSERIRKCEQRKIATILQLILTNRLSSIFTLKTNHKTSNKKLSKLIICSRKWAGGKLSKYFSKSLLWTNSLKSYLILKIKELDLLKYGYMTEFKKFSELSNCSALYRNVILNISSENFQALIGSFVRI